MHWRAYAVGICHLVLCGALGIVGIVGIVGIGGCEKAPPPVAAPPPKVTVDHPRTIELVDYDDYNGYLASPRTVEVRARVRGHIMKIGFTDGEMVKENQMLFELDPRPFQQEMDRSSEQVGIYQAQLDLALVDEKRVKQLETTKSASPIEVDTAVAKVKSLTAQVEASKKEVERKKQELEYATVTAPMAGRIGRAMLDVGNLVNAGGSDPLLATIVETNPMQIYFNVDERAMQRYRKLKPATEPAGGAGGAIKALKWPFQFGLETDKGYPYEGVLDFADNKVDATTGTIQARGEVNNDQGLFVAGSRVRVRLPLGAARPALVVPDTAILADQDRKYVLTVDEKNIVHRREIAPGRLLDDGMRVVLSGGENALTASDSIIVLGLQAARINYPVDPVPAAAPAATTSPTATAH